MSEQFSFDEPNHWNWNQSVSLKSYKNPNFTMSDLSKKGHSHQVCLSEDEEPVWNLQEFNKKAEKKLKNRNNVKNFRQRKKKQQEKILQKLRSLEQENQTLKAQKYCRNCKKPFAGLVQVTENQRQKQTNLQIEREISKSDGKQCFEFQKPNFITKNQKQTNRNGKIWIALGILMLVIGIHLHGFRGKQGYNDISISKIESKRIMQIYEGRNNLDQYFNVKLKYKREQKLKQKQYEPDIFKQIRILHEEHNEAKNQRDQSKFKSVVKNFEMIEEVDEGRFRTHKIVQQKEHEVRFHKDLLYAIQAQIDDVGNYI